MTEQTARLGLPLLLQGQGQKDVTHNEALQMLDALVQPVFQDWQLAEPPVAPAVGDCWVVPAGATGDWAGRAGDIAQWTAGGWRFVAPRDGMSGWLPAATRLLRYQGSAWVPEVPVQASEPGIAIPSGGAVVDAEARASVVAILEALARRGLIGS